LESQILSASEVESIVRDLVRKVSKMEEKEIFHEEELLPELLFQLFLVSTIVRSEIIRIGPSP
jgi:hypothetical protein